MSYSQYTMPIITINMGGEMIYILHQRLKAQKVAEDKKFFSCNLSEDPSVESDLGPSQGSAILESIDTLKISRKKKVSLKP